MHLDLLMAHPLITMEVILSVLILPAAWGERSMKRLAVAALVAMFGVVLPLFIFFFSAFLVPDWKGGCDYGWINCFYLGKLALTPLVLWATGALYVLENRLVQPVNRPVVLGLFSGAIIAFVCFVFGLATTIGQASGFMLWLAVPFYIAGWHGIRALQWMKISHFEFSSYWLTFCGSIPFWIGSVVWSRRIYESLPDNPPVCFVVTAAMRGHESFVGPFIEILQRGRPRRVNQQLITLWQFETLWRGRAPLSHRLFRCVYNRFGPTLARQITSPWIADLTHLAIKPIEFLAGLMTQCATGGK